jgi:hypothetical protein
MSTTDQQVFSEIQYQLIEPTIDGGATWTSSLWTAQEILDIANQRQYRFMKDTMLMLAYARIDVTAGDTTHALPEDWIVTARADWTDATTLATIELPRSSTFEIDHSYATWETQSVARPLLYADSESSTLVFRTMPPSVGAGQVLLLYVGLTAVLTGSGEVLTVPDEFVPAIKYGILADMLRKVGRAHDTDRADYCEARYQEGVEAAHMILNGWGSGALD